MAEGAASLGIDFAKRPARSFRRVDTRVAIFYGLADGLHAILRAYAAAPWAKAVYVDLGYWGRRKSSRFDGYHKMVADARHPTDYFQNIPKPPDRLAVHGVQIKPWRPEGRHILVAGMSAKAARAEGMDPERWESETIERLRRITNRPIVYRPKPNCDRARPIPGASFERDSSIEEALLDCHAVVTHHSNVAVDALMAGIPCISPFGVASRLSRHSVDDIENLLMPEGREQFAADLAYCQYSVSEMRAGIAWRYIMGEIARK